MRVDYFHFLYQPNCFCFTMYSYFRISKPLPTRLVGCCLKTAIGKKFMDDRGVIILRFGGGVCSVTIFIP